MHRPDLVARVFKLKLEQLRQDILKNGVLGKVVASVHVIEFQKRGLPHAHFLIHFAEEDKLHNADDIDRLICAEIPDQNEEPELYEIVKSCMMHGPCGPFNPDCICMDRGKCTKNFPKEFTPNTIADVNGYPKYRRRDNGRTINVRNVELDNRWVVPYNPWLSKKYNAHINVEVCMTVRAVKYLYKYIYKGHDCASIEINERIDHDEIKTFLDARYVSAPEALWRLFEYDMHDQSHHVERLPVHLPEYQTVFFQAGQEQQALEQANVKDMRGVEPLPNFQNELKAEPFETLERTKV